MSPFMLPARLSDPGRGVRHAETCQNKHPDTRSHDHQKAYAACGLIALLYIQQLSRQRWCFIRISDPPETQRKFLPVSGQQHPADFTGQRLVNCTPPAGPSLPRVNMGIMAGWAAGRNVRPTVHRIYSCLYIHELVLGTDSRWRCILAGSNFQCPTSSRHQHPGPGIMLVSPICLL